MIELSRHIKALLLENDCVIIPGLGGFIAHHRPAVYEEANNTFLPPMRTIGFNPQLTINDGVLVQSYMEAYDTDFPDATRRIEKVVGYITKVLYEDGRIELNGLGTIYYNVNGTYEFEPFQNAFFSPGLYGLEEFQFPRLTKAVVQKTTVNYSLRPVITTSQQPNRSLRQAAGFVFRNAVAVAAAVLLFFVLSVPVQNTYVDDANYASLGSIGIFQSIRNYSAATMDLTQKVPARTSTALASASDTDATRMATSTDNKHKKQVKPVAVRTEYVPATKTSASRPATPVSPATPAVTPTPKTVSATPASETVSKTAPAVSKGYYIIISSLPTRPSAEKQLARFKAAGCSKAMIVESGGRFRIAYRHYANKQEAYQAANELKQQEAYKSAWVFVMK